MSEYISKQTHMLEIQPEADNCFVSPQGFGMSFILDPQIAMHPEDYVVRFYKKKVSIIPLTKAKSCSSCYYHKAKPMGSVFCFNRNSIVESDNYCDNFSELVCGKEIKNG